MSDGIWSVMANAALTAPRTGAGQSPYAARSAAANNTATDGTTGTTGSKGLGLDRNAFLKLLLAQMSYQDPLSPMDSQAFFQQLSQLTMLEQTWDMNQNLAKMFEQQHLMQAASFVVKTITGADTDGNIVTGQVAGARLREGDVYLDLSNGTQVALSSVSEIRQS